jgi:hypothetical protein
MNQQEPPPVICQPAPSETNGRGVIWEIVIATNLILGGFLYFINLTNNSLPGQLPNLVYGTVTGCIAVFSLFLLVRKDRPRRWTRWFYIFSCLPSLILGGISALVLPLGVFLTQYDKYTLLQSVASPNHMHLAVVYHHFSPGKACTSDASYTVLFVRHRLLPYAQRPAYQFAYTDMEEVRNPKVREYVRWKDNDTLLVIDEVMVEEPGQYDFVHGRKFPRKKLQRKIHEVKIPPTVWIWNSPEWNRHSK